MRSSVCEWFGWNTNKCNCSKRAKRADLGLPAGVACDRRATAHPAAAILAPAVNMSLANDLDRKFFHALLNGLTQGFIYGKADISLIYLQEQLFGSSSMKPAGAAWHGHCAGFHHCRLTHSSAQF